MREYTFNEFFVCTDPDTTTINHMGTEVEFRLAYWRGGEVLHDHGDGVETLDHVPATWVYGMSGCGHSSGFAYGAAVCWDTPVRTAEECRAKAVAELERRGLGHHADKLRTPDQLSLF